MQLFRGNFDPMGSSAKSPLSKSQVSGSWKVEKTQEMPKVEVEPLLEEEQNMDREENREGLQ